MTTIRRSALIDALPEATLPLVLALEACAVRRGLSLYLVGGPVRDLLLGRALRDVDLMVEGVPPDCDALAELVEEAIPAAQRVRRFERFGTLTVETADSVLDLASARRESYARAGALPRVEAGMLEEDLRRRDFSVNALAIALEGESGANALRIIDVEDGLRDLSERRLRVLHARSFHDDPTRILRAARLAPRLGFGLTRTSRSVLRDALRDGAFGDVSGERLRREFDKLFDDAQRDLDPAAAIRLLDGWDVLPALEPGLPLPRETVVPLRRLGRFLREPQWRGPRVRPLLAGLALWFAPLPPALRRRALRRFSIRGEAERRISEFPRERERWLRALSRAHGRGAVDAALNSVDEERLFALHASAPPALRRRIIRWAAEDRARRIPVSGSDLVGIGLSGPAVGSALARVRAAVLDGEVVNREEALALARELARRRRSRRGA